MTEQKSLDRLGCCPNCKSNWDGGDIKQALSLMDINQFKKDDELEKLAGEYGWTKENGKRFTATKVYEVSPTPLVKFVFLECPECLHVFDEQNGKEYGSIYLAKQEMLTDEEEQESPED